jgi:DNA-binding CsgD family transcriptional regulator
MSSYKQRFAKADPFKTAVVRMDKTGVFTERELFPNSDMLDTEIYKDFLVHWNFRHPTIAAINLSTCMFDAISIWRTPEEGPMESDAIGLLKLLIPHVQIALAIRRRLGAAEQKLAGAAAMADACATATFLLTADGRIVHWNSAAESLVRDGDGLTEVNNHLVASEGQFRNELRSLFVNAASASFPSIKKQSGHSYSLERTSGKPNLQLLVSPMPAVQRNSTGAELLLLVTDPTTPVIFPDEILRTAYHLTTVEIEGANGLLMGFTTDEIATLRHVSVSTVRQQLKNMLEKTETSRQSDMVRLFMSLPRIPAQAN